MAKMGTIEVPVKLRVSLSNETRSRLRVAQVLLVWLAFAAWKPKIAGTLASLFLTSVMITVLVKGDRDARMRDTFKMAWRWRYCPEHGPGCPAIKYGSSSPVECCCADKHQARFWDMAR